MYSFCCILKQKKLTKEVESLHISQNSPKASLEMLNDFQDKLRDKEVSLLHSLKTINRLEFDNSELHRLCCEKDELIKRLNEENCLLKGKLRAEEYLDLSEYWKKKLMEKNEDIHKLQEKLRRAQLENNYQLEIEISKLKIIFEEREVLN